MMLNLIKKQKWYFLGLLFLADVLVWYACFAEAPSKYLTVAFLDVGQGDAIFIKSPTGNQVLIDGGPDRKVLAGVGRFMSFYDRSIDLLMESHPDSDHITGLADVMGRYSVSGLIESGALGKSAVASAIESLSQKNAVKELAAKRGMKIDLGGGAVIEVLYPDHDVSQAETNDSSVVAKLTYGKNSFLFVGDLSERMENYLASLYGKKLDSDVYKVSHHGSKNSNSKLFIGRVSPEYSVISVGEKNRYGHPHKEVLDLLAGFDSKILRTDQQGTIVFRSDGETLSAK